MELNRLLKYLRPYRLPFAGSVVLMAVAGLMDAFRVLLVRPIFDRVLHPASQSRDIVLFTISGHTLYLQQLVPSHFRNAWTIVAFSLVVATVLKGLALYAGTYLVNYAGLGMLTDLRNDLYEAILRRSVAFFQRHSTGTLLSTIINDIERIQFAVSAVLAEFLQQLFILVFTAVVVVLLGGKMAFILLLFIPVILFSSGKIGRRVRFTTRRGQDKLADIQNILHETISGNRIVKAFGMESWENMRFRQAAARLLRANLRSAQTQAISSPLMDIIASIAIAMLMLLGRDRIGAGAFSAGSFLTFIIAVFKLYDPVRKFTQFHNSYHQAVGASSTLFQFMDADDDVKQSAGALQLPAFRSTVKFEHVDFAYTGADVEPGRTVLHDINLEVHAGEMLAIVGSSGSGKSTLVHLIPRFFDVSAGRLLLDGHDVRDVSLDSLRAQVGIVTQETILFNDTVANNIAYGRPHVSLDLIRVAARAALADDFIQNLPEGYDTIIGERGLRLSGGERQRIAIARALLKNAPILILDEATSALDTESEALVQVALQNLMRGRTVFVIAHRLSTVRRADRIVVIEDGRIADEGSHEELLGRLGTYRRLYELQFIDVDMKIPEVPVRP